MLKKIVTLCTLFVLTAFLMVGCGGGDKPKTDGPPPAASGGTEYKPTGDEGTVSGVVKFDGAVPAPRKVDTSQDANCGGGLMAEDVVVADGKLANVFVYVKDGPVSKYTFAPGNTTTLDQKSCRYEPHVMGLMTGQNLKITNSDPTNHNIHPSPKNNQEWNEVQSPGSAAKEKKFNRAETLIPVKCNQHPWMKAYIGVLAHPFFAVTGKDGSFSIKGLPPGEYTLAAWHEGGAPDGQEQTAKVTVGAKGTVTHDFTFSAKVAFGPPSLQIGPALVLP